MVEIDARSLSDANPGLWNGVDSRGLETLREAIALHLSRYRGMDVDSKRSLLSGPEPSIFSISL
ncbi:MAG: hypothetical protein MZU97_05050 [Bacillus subtilis]|nr:hypothetical protein [Bacillus subtilis]